MLSLAAASLFRKYASVNAIKRTETAKMMSTTDVMPIPMPLTCRPSYIGSKSNCVLDQTFSR